MQKFEVGGMMCAACSARVEKAVNAVDGVESCNVNLLLNSLSVEGTADSKAIMAAVKKAGYTIKPEKAEKNAAEETEKSEEENPVKPFIARLISSSVILLVLMYFSMGYVMWNFPLPSFFEGNPVAVALVQMILSAVVMIINKNFFVGGIKGVIHKSMNMDTLVSMGSGISFLWSLWLLFSMTSLQAKGDFAAAQHILHELYFESAAMILTLITVGKTLEAKAKGKTTDAIRSLNKLRPKTAVLIVDGKEKTVQISQVKKGDIFAVKPGESIPVDGVVVEGVSAVNEAALTGESVPVDKEKGDTVSAATVNTSGYLKCEAIAVGEDTLLSKIIKTVTDAAATKAPIARLADKVSGVFVPVVIGIALVTAVVWFIFERNLGHALERGISVLVISCPCALGLATPVAVTVGHGVGAKNGILFKNAEAIETAGKTQIVVLDKTGTVTKGEPEVTDIIPFGTADEKELLSFAASLESKSEHPLAKAVVKKAEAEQLDFFDAGEFEAVSGKGIKAEKNGEIYMGGNLTYVSEFSEVPEEMKLKANELSRMGKTPLFFVNNGKLLGIIAVADVIREESPKAIERLKEMGVRVLMLTGDNEETARAIGKQVGVDDVIAGVLPQKKQEVVMNLRREGKVAMVGDGINDAPALTAADTGIAVGAGTDIAIDAANVVLMKSNPEHIPDLINLSRHTLGNIHQNLFWAFFYNVLCIPVAAGVFTPLFGWELNPMLGAAAMSLSSFCVVSNALRLKRAKLR